MRRSPEGICPILATPFTDTGQVDYASLKNLTKWMIDKGSAAVTMFGIGSEYHKLNDQERNAMIDLVIKEAGGRAPVIVSVTKHAAELAAEDAQHAERAGADLLMLLPPFFLAPGADAITDHVESVCRAVKLPVIVQYAPELTGVRIDTEVFIQLSKKYPQIAYKIENRPPGKLISAIIAKSGGSVPIYVGNAGFQMLEGLQRGAVGAMPGCSMIEIYDRIYRLYREGRLEEAFQIHNELLPLLNCIRQSVEGLIKAEKMILKWRGAIASDYCRKPTYIFDEVVQKDFDRYYNDLKTYL